MANLKNERRGSFYWVGDKPYLTVTNVLKVIDKPALRYWFGREVYYAMVKNPTLSESEALAAPYKKNEAAKSKGLTVHSIVEAYKHSKTYIDEKVADDFRGYAQAFYKWIEELNVTIIEHERTVFSEKYQIAGTLDLLVGINGNNLLTIVDVKTGKDIYAEAFLQTSAYRMILEENGIKTKETAVLLLQEDGNYKYSVGSDKSKGFLACKTLYEAINEDMLKKVGYLK